MRFRRGCGCSGPARGEIDQAHAVFVLARALYEGAVHPFAHN
jgi:hypothetical protein